MMDKFYYYYGMAAFWLGTIPYLVFKLFRWALILAYACRLWAKSNNFIHYHINRGVVETESLRRMYKKPGIMMHRDNGLYILLYRLRNIRLCRKKSSL